MSTKQAFPAFQGVIGRTVQESVPDWSNRPKAPEGAPNVVFIVLDDTGFAHLGSYGSTIETPNLDRLAEGGLRYTNFHTNSMCSPTRASLLTGRNSHAAGVGMIAEFHNGFPNTRGAMSRETGTLAEILKEKGYNTAAIGKWHLVPGAEQSYAGPFDNWPTGRGFEHYYGFLNGETDQYYPDLVAYNRKTAPPKKPEEGYHLTEDLTDRAIEYVQEQKAAAPDKPFFLYLAYGATHAPHQAPKAFIEKYKGKFDQGWDNVREDWFRRQQELGIVPPHTELPLRNPLVQPWDSLSENEKKFYARLQEAFAGFLDHTDHHIGRLVNTLDELGQLDDTIIVLISDNGASPEGGPNGSLNEHKGFYGVPTIVDEEIKRIDEIGGPTTYNHYPLGWASAGNTPLKWYKTWVHAGGIKDPLLIHYPRRIKAENGIRAQYHHVADIVPTVLELIGVEAPTELGGVPQLPLHGVSLAYTFDDADAPTRKQTQYYEMLGHRAIWHQGWKAVTNHVPGAPFEADTWELYHEAEDFAETRDLAAAYPEKVRELVERWWTEAGKYGVLPIDGRAMMERAFDIVKSRPLGPHAKRIEEGAVEYRFVPSSLELQTTDIPILNNRPHTIEATLERLDVLEEGVLVADGNRFGGYALYIRHNQLVYHYNYFGDRHYTVVSNRELPAGRVVLKYEFVPTGAGQGIVRLFLNGEPIGSGEVVTSNSSNGAGSFAVGHNAQSAVGLDYEAPFPYSGKLQEVVIRVQPFPEQQARQLVEGIAAE
ncbi:sulfatase-like hydrolase/transferase [Paenibacillus aurantiacus]|uniref:Sulfatase-like hydrolase/transferase n=1 Tax=Paenibacillus aurantiacus TaxID=1936118 RepID=A0ABV5KK40_9BACL